MTAPDTRPVIVVGAGGNAAVLMAMVRAQGIALEGLCAPTPPSHPLLVDQPYLGEDAAALFGREPDCVVLINAIGSTGTISRRQTVFEDLCARGFAFRGLRHESAIVDPSAEVDHTAILMAGAIVQAGARIGANVLVNTGAIVDHDCTVGDHCHVATGARLAGEVVLGDACHVGAGATIIQQRRIGARSVVAAGACVIGDWPEDSLVGGVPARPLRRQEKQETD